MASGNDNDSGMESRGSKEETPEKRKSCDEDDLDDEDLEETLSERLWGLTEMFPERVRNVTYSVVSNTLKGVKVAYGFSRTVTWVFFSSSVILFAPVIFEIERANVEEAQRREQKQVLLGPNAAMSGGPAGLVR